MDVALNNAGVEKIRSENLRLWSIWRPFDSSFERKGAVVTVTICVLCVRWFSNQFEIVSETPLSCDTVGLELKWAVLCSLLCPETDLNIRIGNQGYVFILCEFWCFAFPTSVSVSTIILRLRKAEIIKCVDLINVLLIGFVKFQIKQWFSAYQDHLFGFIVSLDCRLLEYFFWAIF